MPPEGVTAAIRQPAFAIGQPPTMPLATNTGYARAALLSDGKIRSAKSPQRGLDLRGERISASAGVAASRKRNSTVPLAEKYRLAAGH